ncbi:MAG: PEGA domain-containing protein [Deltaproteobacteria bacterium]|nr:PEGA domain-containing protein [Deltaproteobacteria bacterium]
MKRGVFFVFSLLILSILGGCGLPKETRRGIGNEGFLNVLATPNDAEVYVNGQLMGNAEQFEKNPLELRSGTHKIEIRKAGFASEVREIYVGNQSRHTLKINLKKSP